MRAKQGRIRSVAVGVLCVAVGAGVAILANASGGGINGFAYSGTLKNHGIGETGTHTIDFDLVDGAGGSLGCGTDSRALTVTNGRFDVLDLFKDCGNLDAILSSAGSLAIKLTVDGQVLSPNQALGNVPLCLHARSSETSSGGGLSPISWTQTGLTFGTITTAPSTLAGTLHNGGTATAVGLAVTAPTGFTVDASACGGSLAAGASCAVNITFPASGASGARSGVVVATASSGGSAGLPVSGSFSGLGMTAQTAATSCKAIITANPAAPSGPYYINPNNSTPFAAYCDMVTDGGGWTFLGHVDSNGTAASFFVNNLGSYSTNRPGGGTYGIGSVLSFLGHTQMMVLLDTNDAPTAKAAAKFVAYQYSQGNGGFNNGPTGCSGLSTFQYRTNLTGPFTAGTNCTCDCVRWYPCDGAGNYLSLLHGSGLGVYWGSGLGGNNAWNHEGWFYVR